jgi:hypothetical protein
MSCSATTARSPTSKEDVMDIGKPKRIYTVEPLEDPVPRERPEAPAQPAAPERAPAEPEKVPAGV